MSYIFENFNLYSHYYDLLYQDKDYVSESDYIVRTLRLHQPSIKHVLELGSGTGSYASHLCKHGLTITGLEKSQSMLELSRAKNIEGFHPVEANITSFKLDQEFDCAVSLFHVISYLTLNEELTSCLKQVARHLKTGGIFLFDVWYTPAVYTQKPQSKVKRFVNDEVSVTRFAEPFINYEQNTVEVSYEILVKYKLNDFEIFHEKHLMRHFSTPEIELLANHTGFDLIRSEEFLSGAMPSDKSWGVCYLLKKR